MNSSRAILALQKEQSKIVSKIRDKDPELANKIKALDVGWFKLKNSADSETADLYIYDEIMPKWLADFFGGVSAEDMIDQLNEITAGTINVRINSPGGSVFEAIAIYNALVYHSATINVYVDALAASAASIIAMAGDKVTMMVGSQMMIHDAMGFCAGNAADMGEFKDFLDGQSNNLASIYADRAGGELDDWRALMLAETWATAAEAVELGLADEVYSKANAPAPPSEEEEEEETEEEETKDQEANEIVESLMSKQHKLSNRGYKYAGRNKAPTPPLDTVESEVDQILAMIGSK